MLTKMQLRASKYKETSVTNDVFDWEHFDTRKVWAHFEQELVELKMSQTQDGGGRKELVDVANMAFILWACSRARHNEAQTFSH